MLANPLDAFTQSVINKEREIFRRFRVEVDEVFKVRWDHLFKQSIVIERLMKEMIKSILKIQQALQLLYK